MRRERGREGGRERRSEEEERDGGREEVEAVEVSFPSIHVPSSLSSLSS